jgi:hypothetical protein
MILHVEYDFHTQECDFDTYECDYDTQSVISTRKKQFQHDAQDWFLHAQ